MLIAQRRGRRAAASRRRAGLPSAQRHDAEQHRDPSRDVIEILVAAQA